MKIEYEGSCYVGVVGSELEIAECRDSIHAIQLRPDDIGPYFARGTKGFEARQLHFNNFIESGKDFLLLLDQDQTFPKDTLERLRSHKLPYVSGYYLRRHYSPIAPVWFEYGEQGQWPPIPLTSDPERGRLHKIGASGWGCVLIHRDVVLAVREILKGEQDVIEDDMDVWPYNLQRIMAAINGLDGLAELQNVSPEGIQLGIRACVNVLKEEIRPLRGVKTNIGSDIRFPFYARAAGFDLYGDPDVRCGHMLNYPLSPDDFSGLPENTYDDLRSRIIGGIIEENKMINATLDSMRLK